MMRYRGTILLALIITATLYALYQGDFLIASLMFGIHIGATLDYLVESNNGGRMPIKTAGLWIYVKGQDRYAALSSTTAYPHLAAKIPFPGGMQSVGGILKLLGYLTMIVYIVREIFLAIA